MSADASRALTGPQKTALATLGRSPQHSSASGAALKALERKGLARCEWSGFAGTRWAVTASGEAAQALLGDEIAR